MIGRKREEVVEREEVMEREEVGGKKNLTGGKSTGIKKLTERMIGVPHAFS